MNEKITLIEIVLWLVIMFVVSSHLADIPVMCMIERVMNDQSFTCMLR